MAFVLPVSGTVLIKIYNTLGQEIVTLVNSELSDGIHKVKWDGKDSRGQKVSSGIYIYKINLNQFTQSRKMLLIR